MSPWRRQQADGEDPPGLDCLLDAWAERVRLGDDRAEKIRAAVIADPPALDHRWRPGLVGCATAPALPSTTMPAEARRALPLPPYAS